MRPNRRRGTGLPEVAGVVLAGGRSTRFGRDKLAEPYRGVPMLQHAVLRLAEVCSAVVVVLGPDTPEPAMPVGVPVQIARDPTPDEGPLAGAHAGLLAAAADLAFLTGGDMPDLQLRVLLEMLRVADDAGVDAVALQDGERYRPLPCVVRTAAATDAAHALLHAGYRALRDLLDALRLAVIDEPTWLALDPGRRTLFDVDTPSDLGE